MGSGVGVVIEAWKVITSIDLYYLIYRQKDYKSGRRRLDTLTSRVFTALQVRNQRYDNDFMSQNDKR